jgi:hypothetical protein
MSAQPHQRQQLRTSNSECRRPAASRRPGPALRRSLLYNCNIEAGVKRETSTMSHSKRDSKRRNSKRKARTKALTVLGVAGALSLAGGASGAAVNPPGDILTANTAVTLHEEEISDVTLSTFYVFDHENAGPLHPGLQLAQRSRSRPRQGGPGSDDCAGGGPTCCASCRTLNGGCH